LATKDDEAGSGPGEKDGGRRARIQPSDSPAHPQYKACVVGSRHLAALIGCALVCSAACRSEMANVDPPASSSPPSDGEAVDEHAADRARMIEDQLRARGIEDRRVLEAMARVPRHELVPASHRALAYADRPLPIGEGQTISQPYVVAAMTELADIAPRDKVLEVGTGSGYQAAVLAEMGAEVYTIEIVESLGRRAASDLERLGYRVHARIGDGYRGWPEAAPFDAVIVTAAPPEIPEPLLAQLAVGGVLVAPVGDARQIMRVVTRTEDGLAERDAFPVRFVPMTGEAQR
jgi:protein-L-isoaspartate(D-aspartate) O-methyltransferase